MRVDLKIQMYNYNSSNIFGTIEICLVKAPGQETNEYKRNDFWIL